MANTSKSSKRNIQIQQWVNDFEQIRPKYEKLRVKMVQLLEELLLAEGIKYHLVESRTKTVDSFSEKIQRKGKRYNDPLHEINDFTGIRIIAYYTHDVDKICNLIDAQFEIDKENSVDQRAQLAFDQFGYLSVHKVVRLATPRKNLPEWLDIAELVLEIQVRTVLQHAWAAISHALQYKHESEIPAEFRRRLIRLSGLLELADEEFVSLRQDQAAFAQRISEQILTQNLFIDIDAISVSKYLASTSSTSSIMDAVLKFGMENDFPDGYDDEETDYSQLTIVCRTLNIRTIYDLDQEIIARASDAPGFFKEFGLRYQGAYGDADHWVSVFLIGVHCETINREVLTAELPWHTQYVDAIFAAGEKLKRNIKT